MRRTTATGTTAIVQTIAVDTSICERGFSLMNNLKTVRHSVMGKPLVLRMLMTICSLGEDWKDPAKIPVKKIIEEWRAQSSRGRYEGAAWTAETLAALLKSGGGGAVAGGSGDNDEVPLATPTRFGDDEDDQQAGVDNATAGGIFAWLGRDAQGGRGEHAGVHLGTRHVAAA